jgi:hypothetical protein
LNPTSSSSRVQAGLCVGAAVLLGGAWLLFGTPIRVRWIVARGSTPAPADASRAAADELRAMGAGARPVLAGLLEDSTTAWPKKAWVASVLLRAPFFDRPAVERALGSPLKPVARAAAFALLEGEEFLEQGGGNSFGEAAARAEEAKPAAVPRSPVAAFDPAVAVPVLVDWIADGADPDARFAALLLGKVPPGDPRVRDALLGAVEDVPRFFGKGSAVEQGRRKLLVVDAMQSLLPFAREDPETATRVAKVVAWIEESGNAERGWDIEAYGLRLFEVARGRGVDPALLRSLAKSANVIVRMRLAHTLEAANGAEAREILRDLLGDEAFQVRRAAIHTLRKRQDPMILDLLEYLVEDSSIYCRSDVVRAVGELRGVAPEKCKAALPILVACLEDPWPGPGLDPSHPRAVSFAADRADVVQGAALSLYMITYQSPGFLIPAKDGGKPEMAILDDRKRASIAAGLAADPARRRAVVDEWRRTVAPWPETKRVPALVQRLEDRDPEGVLRACRELRRVTGESLSIPEALLAPGRDDTDARNLIREMRRKGEWTKVVDAWKAR